MDGEFAAIIPSGMLAFEAGVGFAIGVGGGLKQM